MKKLIILPLLALLLTGCIKSSDSEIKNIKLDDSEISKTAQMAALYLNNDNVSWKTGDKVNRDKFLNLATDSYDSAQSFIIDEFDIGSYPRWEFDQESEQLIFFDDNDKPVVVATVQILGSLALNEAFNTSTWMWSWANTSIMPGLYKDILKIKKFGLENDDIYYDYNSNINPLTERLFDVDSIDIDELFLISGYIINAKGYYSVPVTDNMRLYMAMKSIRWASENERSRASEIKDDDNDGIPNAFDIRPEIAGTDFTREYTPYDEYGSFLVEASYDRYAYYSLFKEHEFTNSYSNLTDFVTPYEPVINDTIRKLRFMGDTEENPFFALEGIAEIVRSTYYLDDIYSGKSEYPKYPIETIVEGTGDCEDTAFLYASLFQAYINQKQKIDSTSMISQMKVSLFLYDDHLAVGIGLPEVLHNEMKKELEKQFSDNLVYIEEDNYYYYYVETTAPDFILGLAPDGYVNVKPKIYIISD